MYFTPFANRGWQRQHRCTWQDRYIHISLRQHASTLSYTFADCGCGLRTTCRQFSINSPIYNCGFFTSFIIKIGSKTTSSRHIQKKTHERRIRKTFSFFKQVKNGQDIKSNYTMGNRNQSCSNYPLGARSGKTSLQHASIPPRQFQACLRFSNEPNPTSTDANIYIYRLRLRSNFVI